MADAKDGEGVVVHCFAGKDRTGIVSALLLSLAGVPDELIAADYAASDPGVELLSTPWFESARDETELTIRRRVSTSPHAAMVDVLAWLHEIGGRCGRVPAVGRAVGRAARDVARAARRRLTLAAGYLPPRAFARPLDTAWARCSSSSPSGSSCPLPPPCSSARASSQSASSGFRGSSGPWR